MNELQIFENSEFGEVRTIVIDSEPWFVGKDVAEILGYDTPSRAISQLVDREDRKSLRRKDCVDLDIKVLWQNNEDYTNKGLINESGLYSLILRSQLPSAKRFKRWVTHEVLPAIRKTGAYAMNHKQPTLTEIINIIRTTRETMEEQGATPHDKAVAVKGICDQYGVKLPDCFVQPEKTTMKDVDDMIDFIYSHPRGRGHRIPTYDDFIIHMSIQNNPKLEDKDGD